VPELEVLAPGSELLDHLLHVDVEECRADRRALVHSVLEVESSATASEVECCVEALQEVDFLVRQNLLSLHDGVQSFAIDCIVR
jgi:hypothetical protein